MPRCVRWWAGAAGMALLSLAGRCVPAAAQAGLGRGVGVGVAYPYGSSGLGGGLSPNANTPPSAGAPGFYSNPYSVPTMNPFLNPYAALYAPATPQNAALYFFAAQQSMGGIGSGQLSGSRPPAAAAAPAHSPIPADRRVSDTPGAGAARYFNRPIKGGGVPEGRYNRFGNYYSANGH